MMNLERARELKDSLMWGEVVEELNKKIFHLSERLHKCTVEELKDIQTEIKVYQSVKSLPDDIISREEEP